MAKCAHVLCIYNYAVIIIYHMQKLYVTIVIIIISSGLPMVSSYFLNRGEGR